MPGFDSTLLRFDDEIDIAHRNGARWGYFPVVYRAVTRTVRETTASGGFDDGPRMERLVVHFAGMYFDALDDWRASRPPSGPWRVALRHTETSGLLVLQHLLLGMNAHINHDLAISAATVAPGPAIEALHDDFERINDILEAMIDRAEEALSTCTPGLAAFDRAAGRWDEAFAEFSMRAARGEAWHVACKLAELEPGPVRSATLRLLEERAAWFARALAIRAPLPGAERWMEPEHGVRAVIEALGAI